MIADASRIDHFASLGTYISFSLIVVILADTYICRLNKEHTYRGSSMKKLIVALLATGMMGSALAQSAPQQPTTPPPAAAPSVPGAKAASTASLGELTPFYVVAGVAAVAAIVVASSGSSKKSGTTGTH